MTFTKYLSIEKIIILNPRFKSTGQNLVSYIHYKVEVNSLLLLPPHQIGVGERDTCPAF